MKSSSSALSMSSASAWSSSDDEGSRSGNYMDVEKYSQQITRGVVEFPTGSDQLVIEYPLPQRMRHSSSIYHLIVRRQARDGEPPAQVEREPPLVNAELHVLNDCGYPGRVNKPVINTPKPGELAVNWDEPKYGGPIEGYKIVAKTKGERDIIQTVTREERTYTFTE